MRTIEEKNRIIAEFMGIKFKDDNEYINELKEMRQNGIYFEQGYMTSELKYHISWDWLMPVVEKIDKLMLDQPIDSPFEINAEEVFTSLREVNIKLTFNRIVEFIEMYNQKNK